MNKATNKDSRDIVAYIERFFQTDISYIANGGFWLSFGQAYAAIIAFTLSIAFAHFIPKETYGVYKYILSTGGIISALSLTGLGTAVLQATSRGLEGVLNRAFKTSITWSIVPVLVSLIGSGYYFFSNNTTLAISLLIVALCNPFIQSSFLYKFFLNGKQKFKTTSLYLISQNTISSGILLAIILLAPSPIYLTLAYFGSNAILGLYFYFSTQTHHVENDLTDPDSITYGKHISLINVLDTIATHIDKIILFQIMGGTALAVYAFAIAIPEQLRAFFKIIPQLAIPKFSIQQKAIIQQTIFPKIGKIILVTIPIVLLYIITAPYIFKIFFPSYTESVIYSQVFSLMLLVEGGISGAIFKAHKAIKEQYILNLSINILKITLLVVFGFMYGIWGIVAARLLSRYIGFIVGLILLKKLV